MALNVDLVSQFAKLTATKKETKKESTAWGTVVEVTSAGKCYVQLDGSDRVTPVDTITEAKAGDRVSVTIKNHAATLTGNTSSPSINADGTTVGALRTDFGNIAADNLLIREKLIANEADISNLTAKNVKIEETLEAYEGKFEYLEADVAEFERLSAEFATFEEVTAKKAEVNELLANYATIANLNATNAKITNLEAEDADIRKLFANYATIENLSANYATIGSLNAAVADIGALNADVAGIHTALIDYATIADLKAGYATIASLNAVDAKVGNLNADVGEINTLIFGSASGTSIQTSFANAVVAQLGDAQIKSAMIQDISASKITAGDIITNNVKVKSNDGKLLIADQTIQISDNTRVRVQIGKDASNDYSINIWDANGKLMFSEGGLTEDAVKEQIIRNDMVKDDANISASKLDIDTLFNVINEDGSHTLKSSKVKLDEKNQTLDVAFGALTTKVDNISVGGRNLLVNTTKNGSPVHLVGCAPTYLSTITKIENTDGVLSLTGSGTDREIYYRFMSTANNDLHGLEPGKSYTFSGKAKITTTSGTLVSLKARSQDIVGAWGSGHSVDILTEDTDEWVSFVSTFKIREAATGVYVSVQVYFEGSWSGVVYLKDLKFEEGTLATSWTPAPEDIESDISTLTSQQHDLSVTIDSLSSTISEQTQEIAKKADGSTVQTLSTQYSTLSQTVSGLSQTVGNHTTQIANKADGSKVTEVSNKVSLLESNLEGFKSNVSATYTTKTEFGELSEDFANFSIGGRNLLLETKAFDVSSGTASLSVVEGGFNQRHATVASGGSNSDIIQWNYIKPDLGETYVFSFEAKTTPPDEGRVTCFFYGPKGYVQVANVENSEGLKSTSPDGNSTLTFTNEWKRYWVKWTLKNEGDISLNKWLLIRLLTPSSGVNANTVYIRAPKLEKGNTPTDWSPAPEDAENDIITLTNRMVTAETDIKQTKDSITLLATKKEVSETLGGYYTAAQTDSRIEMASDEINLSVSSISTELNNSYSKGRNLLRNTGGGGLVSMAYGNTTAAISNLPTRTNENGIQTLTSTDAVTDKEIYYRFMQVDPTNLHGLTPGETYILAGKAKVTTTSGAFGSLKVRSQHHPGAGWIMGETDLLDTIVASDMDDWVDFETMFTVDSKAKGFYLSFQLYYANDLISEGSWSGTIQFRELKLEKGSKRTPWTVAPEDTTTIASRLTTAEAGITTLQNSLTLYVTSDTMEETFKGYYTKEATDSRIKLNSDAIVMTVEANYMGGESIISDTYLTERELGGYPASGTTEGVSGKTLTVPDGDEYILIFEAKSTVSGDIISCFFHAPNTTLTVVKSTDPTTSANKADGHASITLTDEWQKYWVKYTQDGLATTTTKSWIVGRRNAGQGTGVISVRNIALMAPSTISAVNSQIKQLADSITLSVTSSVGSAAGIKITAGEREVEAELPVREAFANDTTAINILAGTVAFSSNTFVVDSTYFKVSADGTISAASGTIGDWEIKEKFLGNKYIEGKMDANVVGISPGVYFDENGYVVDDVPIGNSLCFWAGAPSGWNLPEDDPNRRWVVSPNDAPFRVHKNGWFTAKWGNIGGWDINEDGIGQYSNYTYDSFFISQVGHYCWSDTFNEHSSKHGYTWYLYFKDKTLIDTSGRLYATNAIINGTVTTTSSSMEASLSSGGLEFYTLVGSNKILAGRIASKYYSDADDLGLSLSVHRAAEDGITFVSHYEGLSYKIHYKMTPILETYQDGIYSWMAPNLRVHQFYDGVAFNCMTYHVSEAYFNGHIYINSNCTIGWMNAEGDNPQQLISFNTGDSGLYVGSKSNVTIIRGKNYIALDNKSGSIEFTTSYFRPVTTDSITLGYSSQRWKNIYTVNVNTTNPVSGSDRRLKKDIAILSDIHSELFDKFEPVQYKFIKGNDRIFYGLIAQDVESAMLELGIGADDLGLVQHEYFVDDATGELVDEYGIGYNNIIPMLIHEVQKLKQKIKMIEGE